MRTSDLLIKPDQLGLGEFERGSGHITPSRTKGRSPRRGMPAPHCFRRVALRSSGNRGLGGRAEPGVVDRPNRQNYL